MKKLLCCVLVIIIMCTTNNVAYAQEKKAYSTMEVTTTMEPQVVVNVDVSRVNKNVKIESMTVNGSVSESKFTDIAHISVKADINTDVTFKDIKIGTVKGGTQGIYMSTLTTKTTTENGNMILDITDYESNINPPKAASSASNLYQFDINKLYETRGYSSYDVEYTANGVVQTASFKGMPNANIIADENTKIYFYNMLDSQGKTAENQTFISGTETGKMYVPVAEPNVATDHAVSGSYVITNSTEKNIKIGFGERKKLSAYAGMKYVSMDENIVTCDENGNMKAVGKGKTDVYLVKDNNVMLIYHIAVLPAPSSKNIIVKGYKKKVRKGKKLKLRVTLSKGYCSKFTFLSLNTRASVTSKGVVKAKRRGVAKIMIACSTGASKTLKIKITK